MARTPGRKALYNAQRGSKTDSPITLNEAVNINASVEKWEDVYNIRSTKYIHSTWRGFDYIYKKSFSDDMMGNSEIFNKIFNILIRILNQHVVEFKQMRASFIEAGISRGFFTTSNPEQALAEWNEKFQKAISINQGLQAFEALNNLQVVLKGWGGSGKDSEQYKKQVKERISMISSNINEVMSNIIKLAEFITSKWSDSISFMEGKDKPILYKNDRDWKGLPESVRKSVAMFNNMVNVLGSEELGTIEGLKKMQSKFLNMDMSKLTDNPNDLKSITDLFILLSRQNIRDFGLEKAGWVDTKGTLFEDLLVKSDLELLNSPEQGLGDKLKKQTVVDLLSLEFTYNGKIIQGGVSLKSLTGSSGLGKPYNLNEKDIAGTPFFKEIDSAQGNALILNWFRANIAILNSFSADNNTLLNQKYYKDYQNLEEMIAKLTILPRALDGLYDYQNGVGLKNFNGSFFHTALINHGNEFFWISDIAEAIVKTITPSMDNKTFYSPKVNWKKTNAFGMSQEQIQQFWSKKREIIGALINQKNISYNALSKKMSQQIEEMYSIFSTGYSPVQEIIAQMNYKEAALSKK